MTHNPPNEIAVFDNPIRYRVSDTNNDKDNLKFKFEN